MKPALLVIDIQYWFFNISAFDSEEGQEKIQQLVSNTNELILFFQAHQLPVIHILTVHKRDGSTRDLWAQQNDSWVLLEGSAEAKELEGIQRFDTDIEIVKTRSSSYLWTTLDETLRKLSVDTLVIARLFHQ